MLRSGCLNLLRLRRFASADEAVNYAFRKDIISSSPEKFYPTISQSRGSTPVTRIPEFVRKHSDTDFSQYENGKFPQVTQIEGKVKSIRRSGKGMYFLDVVQDDVKVQVCASNKLLGLTKDEFANIHTFIRRGDYVSCVGNASTTKVGELTLKATQSIAVTSPCLNSVTLPDKLKDRKLINSNRVMNYLVDPILKQRILVKSAVTQAIRKFLTGENFVEVQTPIIAGSGTGANAEPFVTLLKAVSEESLQLRVAPELWLKKLVISGFDKVFEIGMNFRNEGIDATHNPEFLTCEFYRSHTSLSELMTLTEDMFRSIYEDLATLKDQIPLLNSELEKLDALRSGNYRKYEFVPTIEQITGIAFPPALTTESLVEYYEKVGQELPSHRHPVALLDNLSGVYLESLSDKNPNEPVFIYNQPSLMSPLAKSQVMEYGGRSYEISLRFELFINGKEYVNSYEEENSPFAQKTKFELQQRNKDEFHDAESLIPDWNYVEQMEYGLPQTGGWGCGIDRLSMLFSGAKRIEDVLPFGTLRDVVRQ